MLLKSMYVGIKILKKGQNLLLSRSKRQWRCVQIMFEGANGAVLTWVTGTYTLVFLLLFNLNRDMFMHNLK